MTAILLNIAFIASLLGLSSAEPTPGRTGSTPWTMGMTSWFAGPETASVEFQVLDPEGAPIQGAVALSQFISGRAGRSLVYQLTDENGLARLEVPAGQPAKWSVQLRGGSESARGLMEALPPGAKETRRVVLRSKNDAVFHAQFVDLESGEPIGGVEVLRASPTMGFGSTMTFPLDQVERDAMRAATSGDSGNVELAAATWRTHKLLALKDGYSVAAFEVGGKPDAPGFASSIIARLQKEPKTTFRLVGASLGTELRVECPVMDPIVGKGRTTFRFSGTPTEHPDRVVVCGLTTEQEARLWATRDGENLYELPPVIVPTRGQETVVILDLWRGGEIFGKVTRDSGEPSAGVKMRLTRFMPELSTQPTSSQGKHAAETTTDAAGSYFFESLPLGEYEVSTEHADINGAKSPRLTQPIRVFLTEEDDQVAVDLFDTLGTFVTGTLIGPTGEPHKGRVTATCPRRNVKAATDDLGRFRIGPFAPGEVISLRGSGSSPFSHGSERVPIDSHAKDVRIQLLGRGQMFGRVVGAPVGDAEVHWEVLATNLETGSTRAAHVDQEWGFLFEWIKAGKYSVQLQVDSKPIGDAVESEVRFGESTKGVVLRASTK